MGSIGGNNVDIIKGLPTDIRFRVDTWEVPGLDGYGVQTLGNGDSEFDLTVIAYKTDNNAASQLVIGLINLQGGLVTVIDDWGDHYDVVLVVHVDAINKKPVIWQGHANAVRVEAHLKCLSAH